jgi:hypothetical protein
MTTMHAAKLKRLESNISAYTGSIEEVRSEQRLFKQKKFFCQ